MRGIVDRIEEGIVIVELNYGRMIKLELKSSSVKEGDVVEIDGSDITVDVEATLNRKKEIEELFKSLSE